MKYEEIPEAIKQQITELKVQIEELQERNQVLTKESIELLDRVKKLAEENRPDSMEFGTAAKGGALKMYFNAADVIGANYIINNSLVLRQHAREEFDKQQVEFLDKAKK